jgi:hypothetical protein
VAWPEDMMADYIPQIAWVYVCRSVFTYRMNIEPPAEFCQIAQGFNKHQRKVCNENKEFALPIIKAAKYALHYCQQQFKLRRWNCTVVDPSTVFGNVLKYGMNDGETSHNEQ